MNHKAGSTYLAWAKSRLPSRYNLATSGVVPCSLAELNAHVEDIELNGLSLYGYPPLQAAIAERYGVRTDCVVARPGRQWPIFWQ